MIAFLQGVASRLKGIRLNATASSLAFTTLLALVPLATVAFAVVSQFPAFEKGLATLEEWLVRGLMPGTGLASCATRSGSLPSRRHGSRR
ncbi:MAG: hypothetical protein IPF73_15685 [Betaproteobacteria bacterium]|nr:hypothetical protein [Betaproteobacteria bacterium]